MMGSVRAARERMEAGLSDTRLSNVSEESMDPINPQWPLGGNGNSFSQHNRSGPPPRPARPSHVDSMLGGNQTQQEIATYGQSPQYSRSQQPTKYWEQGYLQGGPQTPGTMSSRDSAGSSVGSIPDFPVPAIPTNTPVTRRAPQHLGPPPTQRRGPSSHYSQSSYVAPIPEESIELPQQVPYGTRRAQVVSEDWQDDTPDYYECRDSTASIPGEHLVEPVGLVRNASMGKKYKPSMTTVRTPHENLKQQKGYAAPQPVVVDRSHLAAEHTVFVESVDSDDDDDSLDGRDSPQGQTFLRDTSEDSGYQRDIILEKDVLVSPAYSRESSPDRRDPRVQHLMAGLEKGGAIPAGTAVPVVVTERQPQSADNDFATEASQRASLTSLSDLIRRATKVKTNLERGRTASRLGLLDFFSSGSKSDLLKASKDDRPRESLTDMLGAFPPPATTTPTREMESRWPSPFVNASGEPGYMTDRPQKRKNPRGRRCCGLPIWGFILVLALLIVLIAAAVLIPVFLIVLPNIQKANAACTNAFPCSNGGYSVSVADSCRCICTGSFTGDQCAISPVVASDCATANLDSFQQVTLGTKIQPLLSGAANFSIPLNNTKLLSEFSANKLACGDENNLVNFLNVATPQRRDVAATPVVISPPMITVAAREAQQTTAGLIIDGTRTIAPAAAPTGTAKAPDRSEIVFAQTAILYILQQTTLDAAKTMRYQLDTAFQNGNWLGPVVANSNITVDLRLSKVTIGNSTVGSG